MKNLKSTDPLIKCSQKCNNLKEKNKKEKTKNKGITMIALVVTIIVMSILAGTSISIIKGDNGILLSAKNSAESYRNTENTVENETNSYAADLGTSDVGKDDITLTPSTKNWTNGTVTVTASSGSGTAIQMKSSIDYTSWTNVAKLQITKNQKVYARFNGETKEFVYEVKNIDTTAPSTDAPVAKGDDEEVTEDELKNNYVKTSSIRLRLKQTDTSDENQSGIDESKTEYRMYSDKNGNTAIGDWQKSNVFSELKQNTTYYFRSRAYDNAGNSKESTIDENGFKTK